MTLYKDQYRVESTRLKHWNYSSNGYYFVTICAIDRQCYFGRVVDNKMRLSETGSIADKCWREIPNHFPFVKLDAYVIMPNHMHGILIIDKNDDNDCGFVQKNDVDCDGQRCRDEAMPRLYHVKNDIHVVCDDHVNDNNSKILDYRKISPKPQSLPVIIGSYKSICTKIINQMNNTKTTIWQPRYYDHIIRNPRTLNRIRGYIIDNPSKYKNDRNNVF